MQQGDLIELQIHDLNTQGEGVGRFEGQVVFVPDTVPGDRLTARIVKLKRQYKLGKTIELLEPSPHRCRPICIVADKCGGCQWQHISDTFQRQTKQNNIQQALQRIGGFTDINIEPILYGDHSLGYRNKTTFPVARSRTGQVQAGYYRKSSHQLINLNQCPIQDQRLNPLLKEIKLDIQSQGWSIYQEKENRGRLRHLALRIGHHTGQMLLTLISTTTDLPNLSTQAAIWLERYPDLVGVCLNHNDRPGNVIWGTKTRTIIGQDYLEEQFAGLTLKLRPETFFQVNTVAAELLLAAIESRLQLQGNEILLDAYCGIGTFTLPLAQKVQQAIGIEIQPTAIEQARENQAYNQLENVQFYCGTVEKILPTLTVDFDVVLLDPPRKGCDETILKTLANRKPQRIVYISCNPSTLARDLKILCGDHTYAIEWIQPADFFPQTTHVECAVLLSRRSS